MPRAQQYITVLMPAERNRTGAKWAAACEEGWDVLKGVAVSLVTMERLRGFLECTLIELSKELSF